MKSFQLHIRSFSFEEKELLVASSSHYTSCRLVIRGQSIALLASRKNSYRIPKHAKVSLVAAVDNPSSIYFTGKFSRLMMFGLKTIHASIDCSTVFSSAALAICLPCLTTAATQLLASLSDVFGTVTPKPEK